MIGKLKKLKNASNEYMYPITVSEGVYVDPETNLKTKLEELEAAIGAPASYRIELDRWGIKNDGTQSAATTQGINDALRWAYSSGYNHVVLPDGAYALKLDPYDVAIDMISGLHFEMENNCVLRLDTNSSPGYNMIRSKGIRHAKISGGQLIGDKATHRFELHVKFVRGGINADGSLNDNPQFIRSEVLDRYDNPGLLTNFRLWSIDGVSAPGYSFYQYKDTVSANTLVGYRTNGGFAPGVPAGRGWFDTIDKVNKMVFVIDISASPLTDEQIAQINAKVDNSYYTHEGGHGIAILHSSYIEIDGVEISHCTGDGIFTGIGLYHENPSEYTQEEMGHHIYIRRCHIHHTRRQGISICGPNDVFVFHNTIRHVGYADDNATSDFRNGTAPMFGIDIESQVGESNIPYASLYLNRDGLETNYRIYIYDNYIHHNAKGHFVNVDGTYITLQNNTFEGSNIGGVSSYSTQWYVKYLNNTFIETYLNVTGNNVVNGATMARSNLRLADVQGAFITNCLIKDGLLLGSAAYGYFGTPAAINVATGTFTYTAPHGMGNGAQISFEQWFGKVPAGISVDKLYYTVNITTNSFQVSETRGGAPVIITDAGAAGFNISRYNYGRCYIADVTVEKDWKDNNVPDGNTGFSPIIAGTVIRNVTVKNCPISIKPPDNYVGRPAVVENLTIVEGTGTIDGSYVSNLKAMRIKTSSPNGDINLGSDNAYSQVYIDGGFFQGVIVNLFATYIANGTFLNAKLRKADTPAISTVTNSYFENSSIDLHWISNDNAITIVKCIFKNVAIDASPAVKMIDNIDLSTGLPTNRSAAPPTSGSYSLGQIIYNASPAPGGFVGWICTTAGYAAAQTWAASKSYGKGARIRFGSRVYEAANVGSSGASIPNFPTAPGGTVADNTVTWKLIGMLAVFKTFGPIST